MSTQKSLFLSSLPTVFGLALVAFMFFPPLSSQAKKPKTPKAANIHVYPGYCTAKFCHVRGRVVPQSRWLQKRPHRSRFRVAMGMMHRFVRKGIAFAGLQLTFQQQTYLFRTDKQGYFSLQIPYRPRPSFPTTKPRSLPHSKPSTQPKPTKATSRPTSRTASRPTSQRRTNARHKRALRVYASWRRFRPQTPNTIFFRIQIQTPTQTWLKAKPIISFVVYSRAKRALSIISDLDDTLFVTHVTNKRKLVQGILFKGYKKVQIPRRAPLFLHSILQAPSNRGRGILHYVSGSPVHILDRITKIMRLRAFPLGSLNLKYTSGKNKASLFRQTQYKLNLFRPILRAYPHHRFLLVGDNSEKDPLIYKTLQREFPKQIAAILIRNVRKHRNERPEYKGIFLFLNYAQALDYVRDQGLLK